MTRNKQYAILNVMENTGKRIAQEIQDLRQKRKISQQTLADSVGVTRATISNIENAKQTITLDTFILIANRLSIFPPQLLENALKSRGSFDLTSVGNERIRKIIEDAIS